MYFTNNKISKNKLVSLIVTLGAMYLIKDYIAARAQLVTFILFEFVILFIEKFLETKKIRYAAGIVIISIIVANVHCAVWPFLFILFLPYIAEYIFSLDYISIYYRIKKKITKKEDKNKEKKLEASKKRRQNPYKIRVVKIDAAKWLIVIMIICGLTGLLTPLGDTPYTYLVRTMQGNTTKKHQ